MVSNSPIHPIANSPSAPARLSARQLRRAHLIAALGTPVVAALGRTYRWRVDGYHHYESIVASGKQPIIAFWHGRILPGMLFWRDRGIVVMTSENFDGEWIGRIIQRFGYATARGSSSRGGVRALVQLKRDMDAGKPTGFAIDGPRGPARVAQPGAVWLSGATGNPMLPFHVEASRALTVRSWDATQVPSPFATIGAVIGAPIAVDGIMPSTIEAQRLALERGLASLEERARVLSRRS